MMELIVFLGVTLYSVLAIVWLVTITNKYGDKGFITYKKFKHCVDNVEWEVLEYQFPLKILKKKGLNIFDDSYKLFIDNNTYKFNGAYALPITPLTMVLMNIYSRKKMKQLGYLKIKSKKVKW